MNTESFPRANIVSKLLLHFSTCCSQEDLVAPAVFSHGCFEPSLNNCMWQTDMELILQFSAPSEHACVTCVYFTWVFMHMHSLMKQMLLSLLYFCIFLIFLTECPTLQVALQQSFVRVGSCKYPIALGKGNLNLAPMGAFLLDIYLKFRIAFTKKAVKLVATKGKDQCSK